MKFSSLRQCLVELDRQGELVTLAEPVDPYLEMAEITQQVFEAGGPAVLFLKVGNSRFPAVSNLFGTYERTLKIFEPQLSSIKALVDSVSDPGSAVRRPGTVLKALPSLVRSLPMKTGRPRVMEGQCRIQDLPMIHCRPGDGGAFILLPQVFSTDPDDPGLFRSNLGMYRIQVSGNDYRPGCEIGLHYQIHRGIANHHQKALKNNQPLKVSIFVGGPPAHTLAAVMPLPEGVPEIAFAGALAGRHFRYARRDGHLISGDADFCITGSIDPWQTRKEGPFGDHLGYYSLAHDYPFIRVQDVYHRKDAIFPFTVVGRPPQEDSNFGRLIHEITRSAIRKAIPGVTAVHAVDEAGVHPLLLVKAHERYVPFETRRPRELLTHAARVLGTGQLSLAKYLLICAHEDRPELDVTDTRSFFMHLLERVDFSRDLHFMTEVPMDTLDYSTRTINQGSKLIVAAAGEKRRTLAQGFPRDFALPGDFTRPRMVAPGMAVIQGPSFSTYEQARVRMDELKNRLRDQSGVSSIPLMAVVDDTEQAVATFADFLWVTFLRSNPSHDVYGVDETFEFKHWRCAAPLIIDARIKPFHAGPVDRDPDLVSRVKEMGKSGGPLAGII